MLQQCLPLAVLKQPIFFISKQLNLMLVATVLTACGIETTRIGSPVYCSNTVATVLTACGIETSITAAHQVEFCFLLQQCLPLAVLKPSLTALSNKNPRLGCNSAYRLRY